MDERKLRIEDHKGRWVRKTVSRISPPVQLRCEHLLKHIDHPVESWRPETPKPPHQPVSVDSANLIKDNMPRFASESTRYPEWIRVSASGHRRHDESPEMIVQLIR